MKRLIVHLAIVMALSSVSEAWSFDLQTTFKDECKLSSHQQAQIIGWSEDEEYFAVRLYTLRTEEHFETDAGTGKPKDCPGYVDHNGEPFNGGLSIHVFKANRLVRSIQIQAADSCTAPSRARDSLLAAKSAMRQIGIDLTRPGRCLEVRGESQEEREFTSGGMSFIFVSDIQSEPDSQHVDYAHSRGAQNLFIVGEPDTSKIVSSKINREIPRTDGYYEKYGLDSAWESPSGKRLVLFDFVHRTSYILESTCLSLFAVLERSGDTFVPIDQ